MAGLVPAIHVFAARKEGVDGRHKAGHDAVRYFVFRTFTRRPIVSQSSSVLSPAA